MPLPLPDCSVPSAVPGSGLAGVSPRTEAEAGRARRIRFRSDTPQRRIHFRGELCHPRHILGLYATDHQDADDTTDHAMHGTLSLPLFRGALHTTAARCCRRRYRCLPIGNDPVYVTLSPPARVLPTMLWSGRLGISTENLLKVEEDQQPIVQFAHTGDVLFIDTACDGRRRFGDTARDTEDFLHRIHDESHHLAAELDDHDTRVLVVLFPRPSRSGDGDR